mmetsp:Transcript_73411/g.208010  ORF Transcript_73411/g.208010 Transcript_73411/m.208010 type:complete len:620 (+) Transcript_73411:2095-3954(+)
MVNEGLDLVVGLLGPPSFPQREDGQVPELVLWQLYCEGNVQVVLATAALEDCVLVDGATGRVRLDDAAAALDAGGGRAPGADVQALLDLPLGGQRGEDGGLMRGGRAAAGLALRRAAGGAGAALVLDWEAALPRDRKLALLSHAVPVDADSPVSVHNDLHGACVAGPQVIVLVAAGVALGESPARLHPERRAPANSVGVGHRLARDHTGVLVCSVARGAVVAGVGFSLPPALHRAILRATPGTRWPAPGIQETWISGFDILAREAMVHHPRIRSVGAPFAAGGPGRLRLRGLHALGPRWGIPIVRAFCPPHCPAGVPKERVDARRLDVLIEVARHLDSLHVRGRALAALARDRSVQLDRRLKLAGSGRAAAELHEERRGLVELEGFWVSGVAADEQKLGFGPQECLLRPVAAEREAVANVGTVEVPLGVGVVPVRLHAHRVEEVLRSAVVLNVPALRLLPEAGENACELLDVPVVVRAHIVAFPIFHPGPISVQLPETDGKHLHDLPRVVLVREPLVVVVRRATGVREVLAHERAEGHLPEDLAEVPKGMADENVKKVQPVLREVVFPNACADHENLREAPGHPLTELVLGAHHLREPDARLRVVVVDSVVVLVVHEPV